MSPGNALQKRSSAVTQLWHRITLGGILLVAAFLNVYSLQKVGYGNVYYSAAVKSMLTSWHNFFFVSFDAAGFVSVDKPPLGLWIQAASAKLFGFSGLSLILPEAVAGVLSVALLYYLVHRVFGPVTGLIAALVLAITPVSIATNRDNIIDSLLVLTVLLGAWAITKAVETGRLRWLLLCAVLLGLAFNIKTLQAYLVLPAFGLVYLLGAPLHWRIRILHLMLAVVVLLIISFAWIGAVDLTPASQRPYVGSSQTNSELNLAFGYNGLHRLLGTAFGGGNLPSSQASRTSPGSSPSSRQPSTVGGSGGGDGIFALIGTGGARVFRLFTQGMEGQISWLLPLALLGWLVAAWQTWRRAASRLPGNQQRQAIVLWGGWLLTMVIYFSVAGVVHSYYLTMLAPGIAATAAIGIVSLWNEYRRPGRSGWLLPVILASTAIVQAYILSAYASWSTWMTPLILDLTLAAAAVLVIARLLPCWSSRRIAHAAVVGGMLALLIAPATWSAITTQHPGGLLPSAGPSSNQGSGGMGLFGGGSSGRNAALEKYLLAHQRRARFLVATQSDGMGWLLRN